jgi:tetratricopeptide (TPR) repeat protein
MLRELVFGELQMSRFREAIAAADRIIDALPESWSWSALCYKAEALLCLGERKPALAAFDEAIARALRLDNPREAADARAWKGECLLWLGRYAEAERLLEVAAKGDAPYAQCWRGAALYKLGRPREALESIDRGLALYDRDLEAYAWKGEILRRLGRLDEAEAALNAQALRESGGGALSLPRSGAPANPQYWTWHLLNRALVAAARGDERALRADVEALLGERASLVFTAAGVDARRALSAPAGTLVSLLEGVLDDARGCRRPDVYTYSVWGRREALRACVRKRENDVGAL